MERKLENITGLNFDKELTDDVPVAWAQEIDQAVFSGSLFMQEVVFLHRESKTAILCDLIQRHPEESCTGIKGWKMKVYGLVGEEGSAPREWRASFWNKEKTRAARDKTVGWSAVRLVIAHGMCVEENASPVIEEALSWI